MRTAGNTGTCQPDRVIADAGADFSAALRDVAKAVANPEPDKQAKRRRFFAKA